MPVTETSVRTTVFGQPAVLVENPDGEMVPYLIREETPAADERVAFTIVKADGTAYRVCLSRCRGWVCECKDWQHCTRKKRTRRPGEPCKHGVAVQRLLAETSEAGAA